MPAILFSLLMLLGGAGPALAAEPEAWQYLFQRAATPIAERMQAFNDFISAIIVLITAFVLALLVYVCFRFGVARNPMPSRRTHNTLLEVAWTTVPVLILVVIAIPSFKLLYYQDVVPEVDLTVKAVGHQWYWSYEYPDNGEFTFDAYMIVDEDLEDDQLRLLTTDNAVVLPVETNIRLLITATDVLHAWAMPSFGVKMDAVPGRINETWFRINEPGTYYGQCSELCGAYHAFMPIMIRAVSKDEFEAWTEQAQEEFAQAGALDVARR
jgi:cytochrome c oxidase subunit II